MYTVVGLGNPGKEYRDTRHNVGWLVLSEIVEERGLPSFSQSTRYSALISEGVMEHTDVAMLLPTVFMNNSGLSVARFLKDHQCLERLIVVHDDVDLPVGDIRVSYDRGAGGHNGVQSIINSCTTKSFVRIRVGVAQKSFFGEEVRRPAGEALSAFVLGKFTKSEREQLLTISKKVDEALVHIFQRGVEYAMQEMNKG